VTNIVLLSTTLVFLVIVMGTISNTG